MDTDGLIRSLADHVEPVRPLDRPWRRTAVWAAVAGLYLAGLIAVMSPRQDLGERMKEPLFVIEQAAALVTGLAAAAAAFATVVPGRRRSIALWSLAPLTVWIATVSLGAVREYAAAGEVPPGWRFDWACVGTILAGASLPALLMGVMLKRGAPLTPRLSAALGALAAAGLGNLGVCLFHPHSSNLIVLVWHCGTVLALAALAGAAGPQLLRWPPRRGALFSSNV